MTVSFFSREDPYEPSPGPPRGVHTTSGRAATNKFGTISHSHLSLAKRRACTRTNQFAGATAAQGQPSFDKGSTAAIAIEGQHSITTRAAQHLDTAYHYLARAPKIDVAIPPAQTRDHQQIGP